MSPIRPGCAAHATKGSRHSFLCYIPRFTSVIPIDNGTFVSGVQHRCLVEEYAAEKWDLLIAINLTAPFHLTKNSLPFMKKKSTVCRNLPFSNFEFQTYILQLCCYMFCVVRIFVTEPLHANSVIASGVFRGAGGCATAPPWPDHDFLAKQYRVFLSFCRRNSMM
jgi:NAD(P)-dependent dehydrogenase (short-subunit alcohol dehydrogenase family)